MQGHVFQPKWRSVVTQNPETNQMKYPLLVIKYTDRLLGWQHEIRNYNQKIKGCEISSKFSKMTGEARREATLWRCIEESEVGYHLGVFLNDIHSLFE